MGTWALEYVVKKVTNINEISVAAFTFMLDNSIILREVFICYESCESSMFMVMPTTIFGKIESSPLIVINFSQDYYFTTCFTIPSKPFQKSQFKTSLPFLC